MRCILFCEARADAETAQFLVGEALCHRVEWLREHRDASTWESVGVSWCVDEAERMRSWFDLHSVDAYLRRLGVKPLHGYIGGRAAEPGATLLSNIDRLVRRLRQRGGDAAEVEADGRLKDLVRDHLRDRVGKALLQPMQRELAADRYAEAKRRWREHTGVLFAPSAPFHAATLDALVWWSARLGLTATDFPLPQVGCVATPGVEVDLPDPPLLAAQSDAVRLAVRAAENVDEAVRALCGVGAWTVDELAVATEREASTVRAAVRTAARAGALVHHPTTDRYTRA